MDRRTVNQLEAAPDAVGRDLADRVRDLASKSSAGTLTTEEQAEYAEIVRMNDLLALLKLQAVAMASAPRRIGVLRADDRDGARRIAESVRSPRPP